jgi:hypothetical protein
LATPIAMRSRGTCCFCAGTDPLKPANPADLFQPSGAVTRVARAPPARDNCNTLAKVGRDSEALYCSPMDGTQSGLRVGALASNSEEGIMRTKLIQFEQRLNELELMAVEVESLAALFVSRNEQVQPSLNTKCQAWFLGAQGLLEKLYPEKTEFFERLYTGDLGM